MTRVIIAAGVAVGVYEAFAYKTRKAPTITRIVHQTRLHFLPPCPRCGELVPRRPNDYRGFLR